MLSSYPTATTLASPGSPLLAILVYTARSGSTLLASMLDSLPGFEVTLESSFVARLLESRPHERADCTPRSLAEFLLREDKLLDWKLDRATLESALGHKQGRRSLEEVVAAVVGVAHGDSGTGCVVLKAVRSVPHLSRIASELPNAVFVHVLRDPRAVCASQLRARTSSHGLPLASDAEMAAKSWVASSRAVMALPAHRRVDVRFEALVANPQGEMARLRTWLGEAAGVAFADVSSGSGAGYAERIPTAQRHLHTKVGGEPSADRSEAWRDELDLRQVALVESVAAHEMRAYGYTPEAPSVVGGLAGARIKARLARLGRKARLLAYYGRSWRRLMERLRQPTA